MNEKITLITKASAEDYQALVWFNLLHKKKALIYFLGFAGVLALGAVLGKLAGIFSISDFFFYTCLAYFGLIVLEVFVVNLSIRRFVASDKSIIGQEREVIFDETGLTSSGGEQSYAVYNWDQFFQAFESKKYFFLYLNTAMVIILPKAHFQQTDLVRLEELLKAQMGTRFRKKS